MRDVHHEIQKNGVELCRSVYPICAFLLKAIPNGGKRSRAEACKFKLEGVVAGAWDLELCVAIQWHYTFDLEDEHRDQSTLNCPGLIIEVKRPDQRNQKNGGLTDKQVAYGEAMADQGWARAVCYSEQEIFDAVRDHLERAGI